MARGRAKVRFGGDNGEAIDVMAGDVVVLPAEADPVFGPEGPLLALWRA